MSLNDFAGSPLHYIRSRSLLARHLVFSLPRLRRMNRSNASWDDLFRAINGFHEEFLRTLQVPSEIIAAMEIFEREKPQRILEIGTARGGNLFLLSRAAVENALLISLDLPAGRYGGGYPRWKTLVYRRFLRPSQRARFVRGNSHDQACLKSVESLLQGQPIDLLFIDGDHAYEGVKRDYEMYSGLVRAGGLIAFHDVAHHPERLECHVDRFWDEIKGSQFKEIIESRDQGWAGIGILRKDVQSFSSRSNASA
jgi:predicted O-methyltransferase YrrM